MSKTSKYDPRAIESRWQKAWEKAGIYRAKGRGKKWYSLIEFPYPSGDGLHVGHVRSNTAMDIVSRKRRMEGYDVLYPIGWDAFGLPTENYAIKTGVPPAVATKKNTDTFRRQLKALGFSFDWSREVDTTDPKYYRWTQWMFLQFFKKGLAYKAASTINWCPKDKIGLANEEAAGGVCDRCGGPVEKRVKEQWMIRITAYADKLLDGLKDVDYIPQAKTQQENWIGRSEGAEIDFEVRTEAKPNFLILHGYTGGAGKNFIPWLKSELEGRGYAVQAPQMPHTDNPKESEQVAFVLENCLIDERTVLVGHSLGAVVAMKLLQKLDRKIAGLVLVAPGIDPSFPGAKKRSYWKNFSWALDYGLIKRLTGFRMVISDTKESAHRGPYLQYLSQQLSAGFIEGTAEREHFCAEKESFVLASLIPRITVFTTRPDTLFGATYMVVAPEHPIVSRLSSVISNVEEVERYIAEARKKSDEERSAADNSPAGEKTGVPLGSVFVTNPATGQDIPVWVADYVLSTYGTGAIMAVPAHDARDFAFAREYNLPIRKVVTGPSGDHEADHAGGPDELYEGEGVLLDSGKFTGMYSEKAKEEITAFVRGRKKVQYKLRDWVFSRQRYWGEPIPLVHCAKCGWVPVPDKELPVKLPKVKNYQPRDDGESPLASVEHWVRVKCPACKGPARRETDTMPNWAGSSWYFLRYADPKNAKKFADPKKLKYFTPVDWYNGGMEHTVLHLLYSRFWHRFLYDLKLVPTPEPYKKRTSHGLILAEGGVKMSKSKGNVINPDDIVREYGADALRLYEMFMGPFDQAIAWDTRNIVGVYRFLERVWNITARGLDPKREYFPASKSPKTYQVPDKFRAAMHRTIKKVTEDIEAMNFNTAISSLMILLNEAEEQQKTIDLPRWFFESFLLLLAPFAPHIADELWREVLHPRGVTCHKKASIHLEKWPEFNPEFLVAETFTLVIQVNGKTRDSVEAKTGITEAEATALALGREKIVALMGSAKPKKVIYVPGRLVNIVV